MKKRSLSSFWVYTVIHLSFPAVALALSPGEIAEKVVSHYSKLPVPGESANEFEKWTYDISAFSAIHCWQSLKKDSAPPPIFKRGPIRAGTWHLPGKNETAKICQSLADKGISPVCTHSTLWAKGVKRQTDLPLVYLQVYKGKPLEIEGVLSCYLNSDRIGEQSYVGPLSATWIQQPTMTTINLRGGSKNLETGTVMITAPHVPGFDGKEYREIRRAVLISGGNL